MYIRRPMCVLSLGFLLFLHMVMLLHTSAEKETYAVSGIRDGTTFVVCGTVERKELKNQNTVIYLKNISMYDSSGKGNIVSTEKDIQKCQGCILYLSDETIIQTIKLGSCIKARGEWREFDTAENEGQFDFRQYYFLRGLEGSISDAQVISVTAEHYVLRERLWQIKEKTGGIFMEHMPEKEAGIMQALILGDKTDLDIQIKDLYQNAGISHILSLSGLHIAIMGLYFMKLLKKTGVPLYLSSLITITLMTCYGIMTGLSTSTFRALLMFLLGVFSICIKRTYDLLSAAAVSAMLILAENPYYLYDTAFQLSFGAIIGIGVFSPVVEMLFGLHKLDKKIAAANSGSMVKRKMGRGYYTVIRGMVKGIIASLSIQLATLPVIMQNFYQVPIYGTFINLIVVPLMSLLILTGIAAGAAGTIGLPDSIVGGILKISYVILRLYERLAKTGTGLGGNLWITGKPALWQIVLYVLLLLLIWILYSFRKKRNSGYPAAFAVCAVIAAAICILSVRKKEDFELRAISVGQGDCCFIKGKNTPVIIIDGGSSDEKQAGRYRILPCLKANAVHTVDYVFLSHLDSDHVNGIFEIMEDESSGIEIKRVIIPKTEAYFLSGEQEKSENYDRLVELAKMRNIPVYLFEAGDTISEGDIRITCLSPTVSDSTLWKNRTLNENSLVLQITYLPAGFQALFTGDISEDIEKELSDSLTPVHYLKAAHHGSKTATSEWFLEAVDPALTVLSAGRNNSYGHPHVETLERLKNRAFYITYDSGQVTVKIRQGKVTVSTFCADEN